MDIDLNSPAVLRLLDLAISDSAIVQDGRYTRPKTWGVYQIAPPDDNRTTRRFRIGNHPVRQRELDAEFGAANRIALFASRTIAEELQRLLNTAS